MREITDGLGSHPGISLAAAVTYWFTQLVGGFNEVVSALTGLGAFILLCLTIWGKWNEVVKQRKDSKAKEASGRNSVADTDTVG